MATQEDGSGTPTATEQKVYDEAVVQHPALDGGTTGEKIEIAERSQDESRPTAAAHRKVFVVLKSAWETTDREVAHLHNIEATRQYMIGQGLRPTGDGKHLSSEDHPDGKSLILTYEVPATPAIVVGAETPLVTHASVTLDDQHTREAEADSEPEPEPSGS